MAEKAAPKKKPVSKGQANKVASFLKQQGNGGPKLPTPKQNPVPVFNDNNEADDQGA